MVQVNRPQWGTASSLLRGLLVFDTAALFIATVVHAIGVHVSVGGASFGERQLIPAAIVEGLACALFVLADYTEFAGAAGAWGCAMAAHLFAIAGFLLGVWATSRQGSANSQLNFVYHRVMLAIFIIGLAALLARPVRSALARGRS